MIITLLEPVYFADQGIIWLLKDYNSFMIQFI